LNNIGTVKILGTLGNRLNVLNMKCPGQAGGAILGSSGNFRRWGRTGGSGSLGACL
jgi:hypothetical protein